MVQNQFLNYFHPDKSVTTKIAALGGHSEAILAPPGHYQLGKESLDLLHPLVLNTNATKEIIQSGFLSQQSRNGGINLSSNSSNYYSDKKKAALLSLDFDYFP